MTWKKNLTFSLVFQRNLMRIVFGCWLQKSSFFCVDPSEFNGLKPWLGHPLDTNWVREVQWPALFMDIMIKWTKNMRLNMFILLFYFIITSIIIITIIICFNEEKGSLVVLRNEIYNNYSLAYTSKAEGFASRFV